MKVTFQAVYENGVLRPLGKLAAREGERLLLSIEAGAESGGGEAATGARYDFSELAGRLIWSGDPVAEQKKLRDEWE